MLYILCFLYINSRAAAVMMILHTETTNTTSTAVISNVPELSPESTMGEDIKHI